MKATRPADAEARDGMEEASSRRPLGRALSAVGLGRFSGVYIIVLLIAVFGVWLPDTFLTTTTLRNIVNEQSVTAVLALGLLFSMSARMFDLSVGSMLGLAAILTAWLSAEQGLGVVAVIAIVLGAGLLAGLVNGVVVVGAGVDSFIATLGMSSVLLAFTVRVSDGQYLTEIPNSITSLTSSQPLGIPVLAFYVAILAILAWYVLEHTPLGRRLYATGADPDASRLAGIATAKLRFWSLVVTAVVASSAGLLLASKLGSASPDQGASYLLPAFAAVLLGSTQIHPGRVNVGGTLVALILISVGIKGLQLAGADPWVTDLFYGVALIVAVSAASISKQGVLRVWVRRTRRSRKSATGASGGGEAAGGAPNSN